jgi:hypothetical protein
MDTSDNEYFTDEGLPRLTEGFYCDFLEEITKKDINSWLTEWIERMRVTHENPVILQDANFFADQFPREYRDRIVFGYLSQYEMLRQRAKNIVDELGYGR